VVIAATWSVVKATACAVVSADTCAVVRVAKSAVSIDATWAVVKLAAWAVVKLLAWPVVSATTWSVVGAAAGAGLGIADDAYAREARGALGNILQIAVVMLAARTALFVAAERKPASAAKAMGIGVLAFMLAMPIVMALAMAINSLLVKLGYPAAPQASHETLAILLERKDPWLSTLTFAHVTLLVPIAEEGGWRGLLQPSFRRAGLSGLASACLTSLLFAAVHWTMLPADGRVTGLSMLFTLSMAMGILRERTGGIVAPITVQGSVAFMTLPAVLIS
jgi:membrane protease YdiL (CAAX protease family)